MAAADEREPGAFRRLAAIHTDLFRAPTGGGQLVDGWVGVRGAHGRGGMSGRGFARHLLPVRTASLTGRLEPLGATAMRTVGGTSLAAEMVRVAGQAAGGRRDGVGEGRRPTREGRFPDARR